MYPKSRKMMWFIVGLTMAWILLLPWTTRAEEWFSAPIGPRPWTTGEKGMLIWSSVATLGDMYTTCRFLKKDNTYEKNQFLGRHPSDARVILFLGGTQAVSLLISHWIPEIKVPIFGRINLRFVWLGGKAGINTYNTITNTELCW